MKVANGVEVFELKTNMMGRQTVIPTLIWDEHEVILVDTGIPGQLPEIAKRWKTLVCLLTN